MDEATAAQLTTGHAVELIYAADPEETIIPGAILTISNAAENGLYSVRIAPEAPPERLGLTVYVRIP